MYNWIYKLASWYFSKQALPYWGVLIMDSVIIVISGMSSLFFCTSASFFVTNFWQYLIIWLCALPFYYVGMRLFHTYSGVFRYSSFIDLMRVAMALFVGTLLNTILWKGAEYMDISTLYIPYKVIFLLFFTGVMSMWGMRILVKFIFDTASREKDTPKVIIYGVREGGVSIAKSMRNERPIRYVVKGFVSQDHEMVGRYLLGCPVYAPDENLEKVIKEQQIQLIFISPLCAEHFRDHEKLINILLKAGVKIMMMSDAEVWDGKEDLSYQRLHEVDIEDLLPRDKISVDLKAIGQLLHDKRILITGAAGSIGSEMVRQVSLFGPSELILVDQAETPMHDIRLFLNRKYPNIKSFTIVGSISNPTHMEEIFRAHKPEYVFHAAAYKHVPMMEDNPAMAIQNNTYGTRVIADLAVKYGTKKFVMISTDKAVNPTNVMGCSKRICEIYCQSLNKALEEYRQNPEQCDVAVASHLQQVDGAPGVTQFITTRFGNVLGSNGSVIPIFREQIRKGGPVTVTHPDIIRFFMLIPEACQLVLEAGTMGNGGEIFIFDMGKPVRIVDLAQRMIDLSGAHDVTIEFSGLRDGEKLYEEVLADTEKTMPTTHPKIKVAAVREYSYVEALRDEEELYKLSFEYDDMAIVRKMKEIVPEYKSQHSKYESLDA